MDRNVVLAVSGGMDSMVMMDFFCEMEGVMVAHFNHGTRPSADDDEKFVVREAKARGLKVVVGHGKLGENVSEEKAREERYKFLKKVARENYSLKTYSESLAGNVEMRKVPAVIWTAHHINDLAETMAINIMRGTGWRGLTPFSDKDVEHPFLEPNLWLTDMQEFDKYEESDMYLDVLIRAAWDKATVREYAMRQKITFREDPTNHEDKYLRSRIRPKIDQIDRIALRQLYASWLLQGEHRRNIESYAMLIAANLAGGHLIVKQGEGMVMEDGSLIMKGDDPEELEYYKPIWYDMGFGDWLDGKPQTFPRAAFRRMQERGNGEVALEVLRTILKERGIRTTRPQREEFLAAIVNYESGKKFNLPKGKMVKMTKDKFYL